MFILMRGAPLSVVCHSPARSSRTYLLSLKDSIANLFHHQFYLFPNVFSWSSYRITPSNSPEHLGNTKFEIVLLWAILHTDNIWCITPFATPRPFLVKSHKGTKTVIDILSKLI